eukprot:1211638-Amphidinium_carterae.1
MPHAVYLARVPEQLEAVANAAKVLTAHGFALTQAQEVALKAHSAKEAPAAPAAPPQWAGYRPGQHEWAGYRSGTPQSYNKWAHANNWADKGASASASSWSTDNAARQPAEWGQEPDETGYGRACEHHPDYYATQQEEHSRTRGWQRQPRGWEHQPSDESNKRRPGGPDRREKGSRRRQAATTHKITALGRPGAAALATGNRQLASRSLRNTEQQRGGFVTQIGCAHA